MENAFGWCEIYERDFQTQMIKEQEKIKWK